MKCETVSTQRVCATARDGATIQAVAHYTYEIVTTTDIVTGDETKRTRKTETTYTDSSGNFILDPADFASITPGDCIAAAAPVEPLVYAVSEIGCLQDEASFDMTDIPRCEVGRVIIDGEELVVNLEPGWSIAQFVNAVNAAAPGTLATSGNNIVAASGKAIANIQIGCTETVFEEDFGTDARKPVAPPASSTYGYSPAGFVIDGDYAITSFDDAGLQAWNTSEGSITSDASGNTAGNALVVNADLAPGEFYRRTISGLQIGSVYGIRFKAINTGVNASLILPNITARVDEGANTVSSANSGDIPKNNPWTTYFPGTYTATQATADFILVNNAPGGNGNDLAIDEIEFVSLVYSSYVMEPRGFISSVEIIKVIDAATGTINIHRVFSPDGTQEFLPPYDGRILSTGSCNIPQRVTD